MARSLKVKCIIEAMSLFSRLSLAKVYQLMSFNYRRKLLTTSAYSVKEAVIPINLSLNLSKSS